MTETSGRVPQAGLINNGNGKSAFVGIKNAIMLVKLKFTPYQSAQQLALGAPENTDKLNEISGHLKFNEERSLLSIVTLSRGTGDCGIYRVFRFIKPDFSPELIEKRKRECSEKSLPENPPESFLNPKKWPLVNINKKM